MNYFSQKHGSKKAFYDFRRNIIGIFRVYTCALNLFFYTCNFLRQKRDENGNGNDDEDDDYDNNEN